MASFDRIEMGLPTPNWCPHNYIPRYYCLHTTYQQQWQHSTKNSDLVVSFMYFLAQGDSDWG